MKDYILSDIQKAIASYYSARRKRLVTFDEVKDKKEVKEAIEAAEKGVILPPLLKGK